MYNIKQAAKVHDLKSMPNGAAEPEYTMVPSPPAGYKAPICASVLLQEKLPPIRWIIPGLLTEGTTILAGKPKVGKSFFMMGLCVAIAAGEKALEKLDTSQSGVLYLDLDGGKRMTLPRLRKFAKALPSQDGLMQIDFQFEWPRTNAGGISHLSYYLTENPHVSTVVIDLWESLRPDDVYGQRLYKQEYEQAKLFHSLAEKHHVAIVLVHHCNKLAESEDPFDMISGSTGLVGGVANAMVMRQHASGGIVLYTRGRSIPQTELMLTTGTDFGMFRLEGDANDFAKTIERQQILDAVREEFTSPREIADYTQLPYDSVRHLCVRLVQDGKLKRSGRGKYVIRGMF